MATRSKQQVIVLHGGDAYDSYEDYVSALNSWRLDFEKYKAGTLEWKASIAVDLGPEYDAVLPEMPNKRNAKYAEWGIWFQKFVPHFQAGVMLVGHSLGGSFLAKYLSENQLPKAIEAVFLVAPAYDSRDADYSMGDFTMPGSFSRLETQAKKIFLYHSTDDPIVPFADLAKFQKALPAATVRIFHDRGHFKQPHFPELVEDIKKLIA